MFSIKKTEVKKLIKDITPEMLIPFIEQWQEYNYSETSMPKAEDLFEWATEFLKEQAGEVHEVDYGDEPPDRPEEDDDYG